MHFRLEAPGYDPLHKPRWGRGDVGCRGPGDPQGGQTLYNEVGKQNNDLDKAFHNWVWGCTHYITVLLNFPFRQIIISSFWVSDTALFALLNPSTRLPPTLTLPRLLMSPSLFILKYLFCNCYQMWWNILKCWNHDFALPVPRVIWRTPLPSMSIKYPEYSLRSLKGFVWSLGPDRVTQWPNITIIR